MVSKLGFTKARTGVSVDGVVTTIGVGAAAWAVTDGLDATRTAPMHKIAAAIPRARRMGP